jgi:hypothetical protein
MPENEKRVVYYYQGEGPEKEMVLISAPRFGFDGERHVGLDFITGMVYGNEFSPASFDRYQLQLTEAQADTIPGIGATETFLAALHEFACLKKCG